MTTANAGTGGRRERARSRWWAASRRRRLFAPASIASGATSTLTITLTNSNTTTAVTGIAFTDTYPGRDREQRYAGRRDDLPGRGGHGRRGDGPSVALSGATLAAGASCTVTVQVTSSTAGVHVNDLGNVTAANAPTTTGATANLTVTAAPVLAKSFVPSTIGPGATSTLRLVFTNPAGNTAAAMTGISVTDPLGTFNLSVAAPATRDLHAGGLRHGAVARGRGRGGFGAPAPRATSRSASTSRASPPAPPARSTST